MERESLLEREERIRGYLLEEFSEEPYGENEIVTSDHDEEDHVSESEHNTATDVSDSAADDTDRDPDYVPSDDNRDEGMIEQAIRKIFERQRDRIDGRNSVDEVIEEVVKGNFGDSNFIRQEIQSDMEVDLDIIPPSDEEEYREYLSHLQTTPVVRDTVAEIIEEIVAGGGENDTTRENLEFIGKDKITRWKKLPCPRPNVRTRSVNIVRCFPGPIHEAKLAKSPLECFNLMIDDEIIGIIVINTNIFIEMISEKYARDRDVKKTDNTEIKSFIGLLILAGMMRSGHQNLEDLWARDGFGIEIFYSTMSLKRFLFMLQCVRFDSLFDRAARRQLDKLAPFRNVFERFVRNCNRHFTLGTCTTIDEQLVAFRGRCSFRQFMKSKPAKYGIKIFTLTDAKVFYVKNMDVYVGNQPDGSPYKESNKPKDIVLRLATPILNSGRNITADNWFSSIPLVTELYQKNISYVGTVRKNKRELPPELVEKKREANDSLFAFQDNMTLVSYAPKKNRSVILVSSMHHDSSIDESTGEKKKPEIVSFYNSTKSGVDVVDEKCGSYTTSRRCQRWPLVLFYRLLDIGGINAQVIYTFNNFGSKKKMTRRGFLKEIGLCLVKPQITKRASVEGLPRELKASVSRIADNQQVVHHEPTQANARVRCTVCPRNKDVKTKFRCEKCLIPMCKGHMKVVCEQCIV